MACITEPSLPNPRTSTHPPGTRAKPFSPVSTSLLFSLPPEILGLIAVELPYPDALALKHSSRAMYPLVDTSVRLKVDWLVSRSMRGLAGPRRKCELRTDAAFCAGGGGEVCRIMEERRWHRECNTNRKGGCEVFLGRRCEWARGGRGGRKGGWRLVLEGKEWSWDERMAGLLLGVVLAGVIEFVLWFCHYGGRWPPADTVDGRQ